MMTEIIRVCLVALLTVLTRYLVAFLTAKKDELKAKTDSEVAQKYIDMTYQTVTDCVTATNQTFVNSLKASGSFDMAAQKEAFNKTMTAVLAILNEDTKNYITQATGDLTVYLTQLIEAEVNKQR